MERSIGEQIRKHRQEHNLSQQDLAEALGVTRQTVSSYELGATIPDAKMLRQISEALNVEVGALLIGEDGKKDSGSKGLPVWIAFAVLIVVWTGMAVSHRGFQSIYPSVTAMVLWNGALLPLAMIASGGMVSLLLRRLFSGNANNPSRLLKRGLVCFTALTSLFFALLIINTLGVFGGGFTFGDRIGYRLYQLSLPMAPLAFLSGYAGSVLFARSRNAEKGKTLWKRIIVLALIAVILSIVSWMPKENPNRKDYAETVSEWEEKRDGLAYRYRSKTTKVENEGETAGEQQVLCMIATEDLPETVLCTLDICIKTEKKNQEPGFKLKEAVIQCENGEWTEGLLNAEICVFCLDAAHPLQFLRQSWTTRSFKCEAPYFWNACYEEDALFQMGVRFSGVLETNGEKREIEIGSEWDR